MPFPSRRGLVFIDPPYEEAGEQGFRILVDRLNAGLAKWPAGMFAAWYPLKDRVGIREARKRYGSRQLRRPSRLSSCARRSMG